MTNPFQNDKLRDWFFLRLQSIPGLPETIGTVGSEPFEEYGFDEFLEHLGIKISIPSHQLNVLVIGREDWDRDKLHELIEARRGRELRVYSQEMLLSYLGSGSDPLDSPEIAEVFCDGHPALEYIIEWGFDWPRGKIVPALVSPGSHLIGDWNEQSFLKLMGYTAGAKGRNQQKRRDALKRTFEGNLPLKSDENYKAKWGDPRSGLRLMKIAARFSINVTLHSPQGHDEAVRHYIEDLGWLKVEYYDGKHTFGWPSPQVF